MPAETTPASCCPGCTASRPWPSGGCWAPTRARSSRRTCRATSNEFAFRFNRRRSRSRGMVFYRVLELAVGHAPVRYRDLVAAPAAQGGSDPSRPHAAAIHRAWTAHERRDPGEPPNCASPVSASCVLMTGRAEADALARGGRPPSWCPRSWPTRRSRAFRRRRVWPPPCGSLVVYALLGCLAPAVHGPGVAARARGRGPRRRWPRSIPLVTGRWRQASRSRRASCACLPGSSARSAGRTARPASLVGYLAGVAVNTIGSQLGKVTGVGGRGHRAGAAGARSSTGWVGSRGPDRDASPPSLVLLVGSRLLPRWPR